MRGEVRGAYGGSVMVWAVAQRVLGGGARRVRVFELVVTLWCEAAWPGEEAAIGFEGPRLSHMSD